LKESEIQLALGPAEVKLLFLVLGAAIVGLLYGLYLVTKVLKADQGTDRMRQVAAAIYQGAMAYLNRQLRTMSGFIVLIAIGLYFMYRGQYPDKPYIPPWISVAFLMGWAASYGAGRVGMWLAVRGNLRVAAAALKSFKGALNVAFQAGTVAGMFTVGFGLLGATIIFLILKEDAMKVLVGFGFGGTLAALFMRVGGGIFTKAADVGADLVGKVEAGIPEDDPRNPAVIADNVGDNVGDCAGMAADVFESYEVTLVAAIILAAACGADQTLTAEYGPHFAVSLVIFALLARAVGVFSSILGTLSVRGGEEIGDPMKPIAFGYVVAAITSIVGVGVVNFFLLRPNGVPDWRFTIAASVGIALAVVTMWLTNHFTHPDKKPVTETALSTKTGPATMLIQGMSEGLESTVWAILTIGVTIVTSMVIFPESTALASFGIALAGLGLLTTTGFVLAMDTFGPITDNANGIFEMSGALQDARPEAHRTVTWLDAIGNTTKALTKGLAIATAVLAAVSLFSSFIGEAGLHATSLAQLDNHGIQINLPKVFVGFLVGAAVPFLFSAFALKAVGRSAFMVVEEVRRQWRTIPGLMEGQANPEYGRCVDIVTATAQKELIGPAILAIGAPVVVGFSLGAPALGGYLAGAIATGQLLAVFMANTGATWDNAKKKIEDGFLGGKGSDQHKAAVIGDTVGDPFKDTAGPALNPLIKSMNLVAILIAPVIIALQGNVAARSIIVVMALLALAVAVSLSKRGGLAEQMAAPEAAPAAVREA
jgi:K(+)-stimulated pyrophosphate-energized sodium pump